MKDPLQTETTPYEILGLQPGATAADVDKAFKAGLVRKVSVQKLMGAKVALERPVERALLDLFQYDPRFLAGAKPNAAGNPSLLDLQHRERTAASWESQLRANFPDVTLAHSLAVLWYWWASSTTERMLVGETPPASRCPWDQQWERAAASWVMVATAVEFWEKQSVVPASITADVQSAIVDHLRNRLHDCSRLHRERGDGAIADRFQQIELALTTETRTAREIASTGIRTEFGRVSCGVMMLRHLDLLESVSQQVDGALRKSPNSQKLKWLRGALSPFSSIAVLIENRKPQAAIEAIEALPPEQRNEKEVSRLEARALLDLGRQEASLGKITEALDAWERALRHTDVDETGDEIREAVRTTCQTSAAALQRHQRDEAIKIVRRGNKLVPDDKLKLTLAELLTTRGVEVCVEAQKKAEREGVSTETIKAWEKGLADLDEAAKLGNKRATEQGAIVRGLLEQGKSGAASLTKKVQDLVRKANEAGGRDDWDTAVRALREAVEAAGIPTPEFLKKQLALALTNRAVMKVNQVSSTMQAGGGSAAFIAEKLASATDSNSCAICGNSKWSASNRDAWMSFDNPAGTTVTVCDTCQVVMLAAMQSEVNAGQVSSGDVSAIEAARNDLAEAQRLDPGNEHVNKNLRDVEEVLRNARTAMTTTPSRAPAKFTPVAAATTSRNVVHGLFLSAIILITVFLALEMAPGKKWEWAKPLHDWTLSVRDTGGVGRAAVYMAAVYGWPTWIGLVTVWFSWGAAILAYAFGVVAFTRWAAKDGFAKILEVGLYVFLILFSWALLTKYGVIGVEAKPAEIAVATATAPQAAPATPPAARPAPTTPPVAAQAPAPAAPEVVDGGVEGGIAGGVVDGTTAAPARASESQSPGASAGAPATAAGAGAATSFPAGDPSWLLTQPIDPQRVASELTRAGTVPPADVDREIAAIRTATNGAAGDARMAADLVAAALNQRGGRPGEARKLYEGVTAAAKGTTYDATAKFQLMQLRDPKPTREELEASLKASAAQTAANGWFLMESGWEYTTTQRAALQGMMNLRADSFVTKFLQKLRAKSPFPKSYAYLFILLVIAISVKLIEMPWHAQAAKASLMVSKLRPQYETLQMRYPNDPLELNKQMLELYKANGINPASGCAKAAVDLLVVVGVLFALGSFAPQMTLDGARFWWVDDVLQRDLGVLILWVAVSVGMIFLMPQLGTNAAQLACGTILGGGVVIAIAWWLHWPAYLMIFWVILTAISMVLQLVLMGVYATRT